MTSRGAPPHRRFLSNAKFELLWQLAHGPSLTNQVSGAQLLSFLAWQGLALVWIVSGEKNAYVKAERGSNGKMSG